MPYIIGHATRAASAITNSSGLTLTLPAQTSLTIRIVAILILNGSSILALNDQISVSNVDQDTPFQIPLTQLASAATDTNIIFSINHLRCSAQNTDMVVTVPVLLGGAYTWIKIDYEYV